MLKTEFLSDKKQIIYEYDFQNHFQKKKLADA